MKLKYLSLVLASAFLTVPSFADEDGQESVEQYDGRDHHIKRHKMMKHMENKRHQELDLNGDEKVDLSEYLSNAEARFNELDADGDGFVTKEEARAHHREMRKKFKEMRKEMREKREAMEEEALEELDGDS